MVILIDTNIILDHLIPRQPFTDSLQVECARLVNADYIITRNISDFLSSPIPAILPEDFLKKMAI